MRLLSLELYGFKSFPDRTVLTFDEGLTIVVGPNGSGKSNISDAIRWVLGETSSKSVRGTKMEDVIFGGTDSRRAMGMAEVTITLDNTEEEGRVPLDYDRIAVTRRCYRDAESEYLINGKNVRLRDIAELFMNTGLGRTGYSIIGQGRVAEILSQRSEERRGIFEEAAGISKYRYKKHEAENKLETVSDNMVRIYDILRELEARVGPLEGEAAKARQYLEYYEEKKKLDVALWLHDTEALRARLDEATRAFAAAEAELTAADEKVAELEEASDALYSTSAENKIAAEKAAEEAADVAARRASAESAVLVAKNDLEHAKNQLAELQSESEELEGERGNAALSLEELRGTLAARGTATENAEKAAAEATAAAAALADERAVIESELTKLQNAASDLEIKLTGAKMKLSELSGAHTTDEDRRGELGREIADCESAVAQAKDGEARAGKTLGDYSSRREALEARLAEASEETKRIAAAIGEATSRRGALEAERAGSAQRADALRRLEEHFEGYNQSVRAVMNAAGRGELQGIHGPLSRIIAVDPEYTTAVETALGAALQNIVVDDEAAAKAAIAFLKRTGGGRATFCPLSSVRPSEGGGARPTGAGFRGMADTLCRADEKYAKIISFQLGRTAVFDNLDHATDAARAGGYRLRAVTLDGQQVNPGGTFTGGSSGRGSGMLSRGADIEKLSAEIKELTLKIAAVAEEEKKLAASAADAEKERGGTEAELAVINRLAAAEQTQLSVISSRREGDEKRLGELLAALSELDSRENAAAGQREATENEVRDLEGAIADITARRAAAGESSSSLTARIGEAQRGISALLVAAATARKDEEAASAAVEAAAERLSAAATRGERLAERQSVLGKKCEECAALIASNDTVISALDGAATDIAARRAALADEAAKQDEHLAALRNELREATRTRESVFRAHTSLSGQCESLTAERDKLVRTLWDDYELTYSTAAALGVPPVGEDERQHAVTRQSALRSKIKALGPVNVSAIDEYTEVRTRCDFMRGQYDDLTASRGELTEVIGKLEGEMCARFSSVMQELSGQFRVVFRELFGGGTAELSLTDPEHVLESGIEINVAPPGKIIKSLALLSGGEQAFVAIALFFAILRVNPTPFAVFDEIEAALDDVNVARFADYIKRFSDRTQFIVITHRRGTMESAETLYGITMPQRGISRALRLDVGEIEQQINPER